MERSRRSAPAASCAAPATSTKPRLGEQQRHVGDRRQASARGVARSLQDSPSHATTTEADRRSDPAKPTVPPTWGVADGRVPAAATHAADRRSDTRSRPSSPTWPTPTQPGVAPGTGGHRTKANEASMIGRETRPPASDRRGTDGPDRRHHRWTRSPRHRGPDRRDTDGPDRHRWTRSARHHGPGRRDTDGPDRRTYPEPVAPHRRKRSAREPPAARRPYECRASWTRLRSMRARSRSLE
jgi:hypothetical protein